MTTPLSNQIIREITPLSDRIAFTLRNVIKRNSLILYTTTPSLN